MKVSIIPWIVRKLKLCFALVEDGDTASQNIAEGKFVIWKGVCCKAASAITAGETLSGTNLPAISSGALNDISDSIPAVVNNLTSDSTTSALSAAQGKALKSAIPTVVNNLTSDSTTSALSAAQGKALNSKFIISNVIKIGSTSDKTIHTLTIPNNTLHFLIIESTSVGLHAYGIVATTSGGVIGHDTMQNAGFTLTYGTGVITIDVGSTARSLSVLDISMRGNGFCSLS